MPDYGDILEFLASNPPQFHAEREMHASLLELLAQCLRADETAALGRDTADGAGPSIAESHRQWVQFDEVAAPLHAHGADAPGADRGHTPHGCSLRLR